MDSQRKCSWKNLQGVRIIVNLDHCYINLIDFAKKIIDQSELNKRHKISYWKKVNKNQLIGIIQLTSKWCPSRSPRFFFNNDNDQINYEIEKYSLIHLYRNENSIKTNSDFTITEEDRMNDLSNRYGNAIKRKLNQKLKNKDQKIEGINRKNIMKDSKMQFQESAQQQLTNEINLIDNEKDPTNQLPNQFDQDQESEHGEYDQYQRQKQKKENCNLSVFKQITDKKIKFRLKSQNLIDLWQAIKKEDQNGNPLLVNQKRILNSFNPGQQAMIDGVEHYIRLLQNKYKQNQKVALIEFQKIALLQRNNLVKSLMIQSKYLLLPFIFDNHASLIIFRKKTNQIFYVDSRSSDRNQIQGIYKIKLIQLLAILVDMKIENQNEDKILNRMQIISCPSQRFNCDSSIHCLRNIHEFLLEDSIKIDLLNSYFQNEISHYREFIAACILHDKYLCSY